jgi:lipoprotein-releasing system permease protein
VKFEFFIAKRYLLKRRKNSFISIVSLVSIIGISIGVATLIIALSLIGGFQQDIRNKILESTAHIMINNIIGDGFNGYQEVINNIRGKHDEVVSASPVVFGTVLLKGSSPDPSGVILRGVDLAISGPENWEKRIKRGVLPVGKNQMMIGSKIASRMGIGVGDTCKIITPKPVLSPFGVFPRTKRIKVSGIFKTGLYEVDNGTIITNLDTAQRVFGLKNKINYIQLYLEDIFDAETVAAQLKEEIPLRLAVITWKDLNASLYSALKLEKTVLFFTLTLIIIVASLNIIAGLILLVVQKIKDIGILLSYGATPKIIERIFFIQGSIIGVVGTVIGITIGLLFCYFANKFELIKVPPEIYQMSHVPFNIGLVDFLAVVMVSLVISFTATVIPSRKAASVRVIDALKSE